MPNGETFAFSYFRRCENGGENVLSFSYEMDVCKLQNFDWRGKFLCLSQM